MLENHRRNDVQLKYEEMYFSSLSEFKRVEQTVACPTKST